MNIRIIASATPVMSCVLAGLLTIVAALTVLTPTAAAEECPNAALRTGPSAHLPDCRAYELVTPAAKELGIVRNHPQISPDGDSALLFIGSAIDGTEGFWNFAFGTPAYSTQRTAAGWTSTGDELPGSEYEPFLHSELYNFMGTDLDGQTTVYTARKAGQAENRVDFFERLPDRSIADVGPGLPPSAPSGTPFNIGEPADVGAVGMSADGSRLLFDLAGDFWPGDETEEDGPLTEGGRLVPERIHSLYEYLGTGNTTPLLVGVNNEGRQIDRCGTALGDSTPRVDNSHGPRDAHNALSMDGNTVFFTAYPDDYEQDGCTGTAPPVAEIFARIDNGLPGAHTVAISEPSKEDCSACNTEAGVLANAEFVGASEDGSKVFFITTQPLIGSDTSTNIYEYDFDAPAGERLVRVSGGDATVSNPTTEVLPVETALPQISEDGSHVFFVANGVSTETPNEQGEVAEQGAENLYVFERDTSYPAGRTAFVAQLSPQDVQRRWLNDTESLSGPNVTPDGRYLLFNSERDLTPDDTTTSAEQLFEYDAQTGALVRVSIGQDGYNHNGNVNGVETRTVTPFYGFRYEASAYSSFRSVSADGSYVFFESSVKLTPLALEGVENVYEYHDARVSLVSDGQDETGYTHLIGTDESGNDVFFKTADRLAPQDTDDLVDIYDARVDGGFPGPVSSSCEGESCQGPLSGAPVLLSPGSEFQAGGNPPLESSAASNAPAKRSVKPKVKKKAKKRKRRARTAAARGRAHRKAGRS